MASLFASLYDSLSFANVLLALLLLLLLHYLMMLYEFRNLPPGPRLTAISVLRNVLSLDSVKIHEFCSEAFTTSSCREFSHEILNNKPFK